MMNYKMLRAILWNMHDELKDNEGLSIDMPKAYYKHLYKMHYEFFPAGPHEKYEGHFGKKPIYIYLADVDSMQVHTFDLSGEQGE